MNRRTIQENLASAISYRALQGDTVGEQRVESITDICRRHWLQLVGLIKRGPKAATPAAVNAILQGMTTAVAAAIEPVLLEAAGRGFDSAFEVWVDYLPRTWWKLAFRDDAQLNLLEAADDFVSFNYGDPGDLPGKESGKRSASSRFRKYGSKKSKPPATDKVFKPDEPKPAVGKSGKFSSKKPKPLKKADKVRPVTASRIKAKIKPTPRDTLKIIRSRGWKSRLEKWSAEITDKDNVAATIAKGFDKGWSFERIVKAVKPDVQNYTSSARRIVRTELARIENQMMEDVFAAFNDIIDGFQIINPLDERTRPTHGIRAGRIYWNDKKRKPHASERPELPDAPNCRCCYAPILSAPAPAELLKGPRPDSRSYAAWFNDQPDDVKAKVVGRKRWAAVKSHTTRPSLYDFTDKKSGRFLSPGTLKKPRPAGAREAAKAAKKADLSAAKKSSKFWPAKS